MGYMALAVLALLQKWVLYCSPDISRKNVSLKHHQYLPYIFTRENVVQKLLDLYNKGDEEHKRFWLIQARPDLLRCLWNDSLFICFVNVSAQMY